MNTNTRKHVRKSAAHHAREIATAERTAANYRKLAAAAAEMGLEYEVERLNASARDFDEEIDLCIEAATADGWTCDDIEAAS